MLGLAPFWARVKVGITSVRVVMLRVRTWSGHGRLFKRRRGIGNQKEAPQVEGSTVRAVMFRIRTWSEHGRRFRRREGLVEFRVKLQGGMC